MTQTRQSAERRAAIEQRPQLERVRLTRREMLGVLGAGTVGALSKTLSLAAPEPEFPKGAVIRTVLADLQPSTLAGRTTLVHEHLTHSKDVIDRIFAHYGVKPPPPTQPEPIVGCAFTPWNECENLRFMVEELKRTKQDGVGCIVDATHPDGGRDLPFLTEMSRRSGLAIVASAGYYIDYMYPPEIATMSEDDIVRELIRDATVNPLGALGEIGTSDTITANERRVLRAVSKAHLVTNLPIFTHTMQGKEAEQQLDIFESMGVDPKHVVIGHLGAAEAPDIAVHRRICRRGAFVGFDQSGNSATDDRNVPVVLRLIEDGFGQQLILSSDFGSRAWPNMKQNGGPGYSKALLFAGKLGKAGVPQDMLQGMLSDNPRRFLAFVPKVARRASAQR